MHRFVVRLALLLSLAMGATLHAEPGRLISASPMAAGIGTAKAWRIRYETLDQKNRPTESTGMVIAPADRAAGPRDIVAWNHGTVGIVEACAPSLQTGAANSIPGVTQLIAKGYVVVATDYPGLGTPTPHAYLVGLSAGQAILDGVRAARKIAEVQAGNRLVLWGHSQGGHASLWAGQIQKSYAPEFLLAGIAAISPPTDLPAVLDGMDPTAKGILTGYVLRSWNKAYGLPYPRAVSQDTIGIIGRATKGCAGGKTDPLQLIRVITLKDRLGGLGLPGNLVWGPVLRRNSIGTDFGNTPMLVVSATADKLIADSVTKRFVATVRARGTPVTFIPIDGGDHGTTAIETADQAVQWITDRFRVTPQPRG